MRLLGSRDLVTLIYSDWVYSLYMAATSLYPCSLILFFAVISMNATSRSSFFIPCIKRFLLPNAVELGVIFPPTKIHIGVLNTFSCVAQTCVHVFIILSFHVSCFWFVFILVYFCIIASIFFYLFWLFYVFNLPNFCLRRHSWWWRLLGQFGLGFQ